MDKSIFTAVVSTDLAPVVHGVLQALAIPSYVGKADTSRGDTIFRFEYEANNTDERVFLFQAYRDAIGDLVDSILHVMLTTGHPIVKDALPVHTHPQPSH